MSCILPPGDRGVATRGPHGSRGLPGRERASRPHLRLHLRDARLLELTDDEVVQRFARIADPRSRLHAYVRPDGWEWDEAMAVPAGGDRDIGLDVLVSDQDPAGR